MQLWADYLDKLKQEHLQAASEESSAEALEIKRQQAGKDVVVGRPAAGRSNSRIKGGVGVGKPSRAGVIQTRQGAAFELDSGHLINRLDTPGVARYDLWLGYQALSAPTVIPSYYAVGALKSLS